MTANDLEEMIEYTTTWKTYVESLYVKDEDQENKSRFIKQMD